MNQGGRSPRGEALAGRDQPVTPSAASRLLHYTEKPLDEVHDTDQDGERLFKPRGLWLSVEGEDDWKSWCDAEDFRDCDAMLCYEILIDLEDVLWLSGVADIWAFHRQYNVVRPYPYDVQIDWPAVSRDFAGLVIAPYQWGLRLDSGVPWYYSWDCASGCIWRAAAVESTELVSCPQ